MMPLKEVLEQHISLVEDHLSFLEIVHKTTVPSSDDSQSVEMLVQRARTMLADCKSVQRELSISKNIGQSPVTAESSNSGVRKTPQEIGSGPTHKRKASLNGDAADAPGRMSNLQSKKRAVPPSSTAAGNDALTDNVAEAVPSKKRRIGTNAALASDAFHTEANDSSSTEDPTTASENPRHGATTTTKRDSDSESNSREKRAKTRHEFELDVRPESPVVEFENIDDAVDARLREKKEKRERKKRKLSSGAATPLEDDSAHLIDQGSRVKKRIRKIDEEAERGHGQTSKQGKRSRSKDPMTEENEQRITKKKRTS